MLPKPKEADDTLLVVKINKRKRAAEDFFIYYRLVFEDGRFLTVFPRAEYKMTRGLPPGEYRIYKRVSVDIETNKILEEAEMDVSLSLKAGELTIFPYQIDLLLRTNPSTQDSRRVVQYFSLEEQQPSDYEEIVSELSESPNFAAWEVDERRSR
jgi:hypothetical protein